MRTAHYLLLSAILIFFPHLEAQAQQVESSTDRPSLVLVKGDTSNSCSFVSTDVLERTADIVQGLFFVQLGDSPDAVESKMRFTPDQPYGDSLLQWTAIAQGNYTKSVVNFADNGAASRTFTMATNYNQPDEKRCQWEVQEPQQNPEENFSTPDPSLSQ